MKIIIELKETYRGDVEFSMESVGSQGSTRKEQCYAINIKDLLMLALPELCKKLGGVGVIGGQGDPSKS